MFCVLFTHEISNAYIVVIPLNSIIEDVDI